MIKGKERIVIRGNFILHGLVNKTGRTLTLEMDE